ncbi:hypothetical protein M5689_012355 [Euphorbia peplus]|nr:hypothetical protein M5689_012355 [Euphorbia peplus]
MSFFLHKQLSFRLLFHLLFLGSSSASLLVNEEADEALLRWKATLQFDNQTRKSLVSSWSLSTPSCNWSSISCDHNATLVTNISLSGYALNGRFIYSLNFLSFPYLKALDLSNNSLTPRPHSSATY